jgi:hypothetical protein
MDGFRNSVPDAKKAYRISVSFLVPIGITLRTT